MFFCLDRLNYVWIGLIGIPIAAMTFESTPYDPSSAKLKLIQSVLLIVSTGLSLYFESTFTYLVSCVCITFALKTYYKNRKLATYGCYAAFMVLFLSIFFLFETCNDDWRNVYICLLSKQQINTA